MPEIEPFRGIRYNSQVVDFSSVVAPPYDVITPEQQAALYEASPYNIVRLILGREENRYSAAAKSFHAWRESKILVRDADPALYVVSQSFTLGDKTRLERRGFIARCRLEDFGKGSILPHEKTLSKPKEDRFRLLMATRANFSQIFGLYPDREGVTDHLLEEFTQVAPEVVVEFEGVVNRMWRVRNAVTIQAIRDVMADMSVLVADGHHRYETALAYRDAMKLRNPGHTGKEAYNYTMMFFTNLHSPGLVILPTHRLLHSLPDFDVPRFLDLLKPFFHIDAQADEAELMTNLAARVGRSFGIVLPSVPHFLLCRLKETADVSQVFDGTVPEVLQKLDVILLHNLVFGRLLGISSKAQEEKHNIDYQQDAGKAIEAVRSGRAQAAFLLNPTPIEQVRAVAESGHTMPQKSTFFYPKLLSGLVINSLEDD